MKFVTEFAESFSAGLLHATRHKVRRWVILSLLMLLVTACWAAGVLCLVAGVFAGVIFIAYGFVFLIFVDTAVTLFHTDEINRDTEAQDSPSVGHHPADRGHPPAMERARRAHLETRPAPDASPVRPGRREGPRADSAPARGPDTHRHSQFKETIVSDNTIAAAVPWQGVAFSVPGIPYPQGSKTATVRGGHAVMFEDNKRTLPWRQKVATAARDAMNGHPAIDGPVEVAVTFFFTRPKTVKREYPAVVPDVDKLLRAIFDGLANGGVFVNDSRVVDVTARKRYADFPCAQITVKAIA